MNNPYHFSFYKRTYYTPESEFLMNRLRGGSEAVSDDIGSNEGETQLIFMVEKVPLRFCFVYGTDENGRT